MKQFPWSFTFSWNENELIECDRIRTWRCTFLKFLRDVRWYLPLDSRDLSLYNPVNYCAITFLMSFDLLETNNITSILLYQKICNEKVRKGSYPSLQQLFYFGNLAMILKRINVFALIFDSKFWVTDIKKYILKTQ